MSLSFHHVTFTHDGAVSPLFEEVTVHLAEGWTGIVGANGSGKTTFLRLAAGYLKAQKGSVQRPGPIVFCPQRTDDLPEQLPLLISSDEAEACVLRGRLRIGEEWAGRWPTLSQGERKRAQIAVALWQQRGTLLLDEPTNHIDLVARELLIDALALFRGTGLLVSHDRDLLDRFCRQCLFLDPPRVTLRPGNYTKAAADAEREEASLRARRSVLQENLERLEEESKRRCAKASRADKKNSKRHLARGDSDGRARIDLARVSGQDGNDDIVVLSFYVRDQRAAVDLVNWFEKGYEYIIDADRSPGELKPNRYLVYVEMKRRSNVVKHLHEMLEDLSNVTEFDPSEWAVRYKDQVVQFDVATLESIIPLSPKEYRANDEVGLNEYRNLAGLKHRAVFEKDEFMLALQRQAGM